jgi:hypothetical protein
MCFALLFDKVAPAAKASGAMVGTALCFLKLLPSFCTSFKSRFLHSFDAAKET